MHLKRAFDHSVGARFPFGSAVLRTAEPLDAALGSASLTRSGTCRRCKRFWRRISPLCKALRGAKAAWPCGGASASARSAFADFGGPGGPSRSTWRRGKCARHWGSHDPRVQHTSPGAMCGTRPPDPAVAKNGGLQRLCFANRLSRQETGPYSRFAGKNRGLTVEIRCKPPILASTNAVSPRFLPRNPSVPAKTL